MATNVRFFKIKHFDNYETDFKDKSISDIVGSNNFYEEAFYLNSNDGSLYLGNQKLSNAQEVQQLIENFEQLYDFQREITTTNTDGTVTTETIDYSDIDKGKAIRTIAIEELSYQLLSDKAEADFKTLQELGAWIEDHPESVAEMNFAIQNNTDDINDIKLDIMRLDVQPDWDLDNDQSHAYIKNKIPIKNGTGENAIIIGNGDATGEYSIAGGTNDTSLVSDMIGILGSLASIDKPTAYGDMSLSFGAGTKALTAGTVAMGANTTAGCKGFYFWSIDFANKVITLSTNQKPIIFGNRQWTDAAKTQLGKWAKDDVISIVNDSKYVLCSKITSIDATNGTITVDNLPFTEVKTKISLNFDDYAVMCPSKPTIGVIDQGLGAFAVGLENKASGSFAHVEGWNNLGAGDFSHVEGRDNKAGYAAHAEGKGSQALGESSHTEGSWTTASAGQAHAEGYNTQATQQAAHAEGIDTIASGYQAHSEGQGTEASGNRSHAEGNYTRAIQGGAHSEGEYTLSAGYQSHAEGSKTTASGNQAHAEGSSGNTLPLSIKTIITNEDGEESEQTTEYTYTDDNSTLIEVWRTNKFSLAKGESSHSEGKNTLALQGYTHSEGENTIASGWHAHAEGRNTEASGNRSHAEGDGSKATISGAHAEGEYTLASGYQSHSEGAKTIASGNHSHAEGYQTNAHGEDSHAEGNGSNVLPENFADLSTYDDIISAWESTPFSVAKGKCSHTEGKDSLALGNYAHAEGYKNISINNSHAEGELTRATGWQSHTEGNSTIAKGYQSHAEGMGTKANGNQQHVQGRYNIEDNANKYAHIVGGGTFETDRKNIHTLDWDGNAIYSGTVTGKDFITSDGVSLFSLLGDIESILSSI